MAGLDTTWRSRIHDARCQMVPADVVGDYVAHGWTIAATVFVETKASKGSEGLFGTPAVLQCFVLWWPDARKNDKPWQMGQLEKLAAATAPAAK